jgi:hypothetical protein
MPRHSTRRVDTELLELGGSYSRDELAEKWGYAGREALTRGVFCPAGDDKILLFVTQEKRQDLTQYKDHISEDMLFWEGENRHGSDDRVARAAGRGEHIFLFYRRGERSPFTFLGEIRSVWHQIHRDRPSQFVFRLAAGVSPGLQPDETYRLPESWESTTREVSIQARVGQAQFRQSLLDRWEYRCSVSDVRIPEILRASHIRPWREASDTARLDPANGLLLAPQYDALFDRRLITFSPSGSILIANHLDRRELERLGVTDTDRLRALPEDTARYLEHHRLHCNLG